MKSVKVIIDIAMLVFIPLSLIRWNGDPTFHIVVGSVFTILFISHFLVNVKTFISMTKKLDKLSSKMKLQYAVDVVLIVLWSIVVVAGVIAAMNYFNTDASIREVGRLHGVLGRVGCGFILLHVVQHIKQVRSYF